MSFSESQWCDWCGKSIPAQTRRNYDGRVFCCDQCLAEYRAGIASPTVVELPVGGSDES